LPPVVDFANILQAAFVPILFYQQITKPNCKKKKLSKILLYKKAAQNCHLVSIIPTSFEFNENDFASR
jgi:hypothetical protein